MILNLKILHTLGNQSILLNFVQKLVVLLLLKGDKNVVFACHAKLGHILCDQSLHLQRVKIFLEHKHVFYCLLDVFELAEFYKQHVVQRFEICGHVHCTDLPAQIKFNFSHLSFKIGLSGCKC